MKTITLTLPVDVAQMLAQIIDDCHDDVCDDAHETNEHNYSRLVNAVLELPDAIRNMIKEV